MPSDSVQKGIQAIQAGKPKEGKRLIRYGLRHDEMNKHERVQALTWLAETDNNPQFKVEQYQQAIQIDPTNQDVIRRLSYWMSQAQQSQSQPPQGQNQNPPLPTMPQQPNNNAQAPQQQPPQWNSEQFNQPQDDSQQWHTGGFNQVLRGDSQPLNPPNLNNVRSESEQLGSSQFNTLRDDSQRWQTNNARRPQSDEPWDPNRLNQIGNPQAGQQWGGDGFNQPPQQQNQAGNHWEQWNQQQINQLNDSQQINWQRGGTSHQVPVQNQPIQLQQVQRTVGISGGTGGNGTGFFVTLDGIVATTRHIVGSALEVMVHLLDGRQTQGKVVRAFPNFDLVLVKTNIQLIRLMNVIQQPNIPDDLKMVAVTHSGQGLRTAKRRSMNNTAPHWFPTLINKLMDEGGNPMFDERNVLIGMLTKNASRSNGYMYGLHIHKIYDCVDQYVYELGQVQDRQTIYCNSCGIISVAPTYQAFFCENCGIKHPYVENEMLRPQPSLAGLYGENDRPCRYCGSQAGIFNGSCLRCDKELV